MSPVSRVVIAGLVAAAVVGGFVLWRLPPATRPPSPPIARPVVPIPPPPAPVPAPPAIRHPIDPDRSPSSGALPPLDDSDGYLKNALGQLLGRKSLPGFLVLDDFARRFVATVANLATDNAAAEMWPVNRTAGHLETEARPGGDRVISAGNADRYAGFVRFVAGTDAQRTVALYIRLYPLLQRAYEDLGFPGKYFNDRVVEVIDHLLATPDVAGPIKVKLVEVDGAARRGQGEGAGLYVFADPALEASSAGQKILLRMGRENAASLKAKLADIRVRIASAAGPGSTAGR